MHTGTASSHNHTQAHLGGAKPGGQAQRSQLLHLALIQSKLVLLIQPAAQALRCRALLGAAAARRVPPLAAPA